MSIWSRLTNLRLDTVVNKLTGLGTEQDRAQHSQPSGDFGTFTEQQLESLYLHGRFCRRIVDKPAQDATRHGWNINYKGLGRGENETPFEDERDRLSPKKAFRKAHKTARKTGGAISYFVVDDGKAPSEPLEPEKISQVEAIQTLGRFEIEPEGEQKDLKTEEWGDPKHYRIQQIKGGLESGETESGETEPSKLSRGDRIHHSRVHRWNGLEVSDKYRDFYNSFGQPVLESAWLAIRDLDMAAQSLATSVQQFQYNVFKAENLEDLLASGDGGDGAERLQQRLSMMHQSMSILRLLVIDSDEEIQTRSIDLSGAIESYKVFQQNLSAEINVPLTLVFGLPPKGFSSNDETALENYNTYLSTVQDEKYRGAIERLIRLLKHSSGTSAKPKSASVGFVEPEEKTAQEKANTRKTIAETDARNIQAGVYTAEDARSRYTGDGLSLELGLEEDEMSLDYSETEQDLEGYQDLRSRALNAELNLDSIDAPDPESLPFEGTDDPNLPSHIKTRSRSLRKMWIGICNGVYQRANGDEKERAQSAFRAANTLLERSSAGEPPAIESTLERHSDDSEREDQLTTSAGGRGGLPVAPFIDPPSRIRSLSEDLQSVWVNTFNRYIRNKHGNQRYKGNSSLLEEHALKEAWNKVMTEKLKEQEGE